VEDRYSFADSFTGLENAFYISLHLRRFGYKTRLVSVPIVLTQGVPGVMYTVVATPKPKPSRKELGLWRRP